MNLINRGKITKTQFLNERRNSNTSYNTGSAYDLNENGGFIADKKISGSKR